MTTNEDSKYFKTEQTQESGGHDVNEVMMEKEMKDISIDAALEDVKNTTAQPKIDQGK